MTKVFRNIIPSVLVVQSAGFFFFSAFHLDIVLKKRRSTLKDSFQLKSLILNRVYMTSRKEMTGKFLNEYNKNRIFNSNTLPSTKFIRISFQLGSMQDEFG